ncbi:MAG: S9 family peptidase [Bryobacteraceae bacterium]|nr:S9 family peptidase [Bryobacteraceae bacterium]
MPMTIAFLLCLAAWTPQTSMQVRRVGAVTPSPDGRLAAYTQARAILEPGKSRWLAQAFLARAGGSHPVQLTRDEAGAGSLSFSPDGRFLYFLSRRSGLTNLWRIAIDGGEAERLTDWRGSFGAYQLSPDGKWVAVAGADPTGEVAKARPPRPVARVAGEEQTNFNLWRLPVEHDAGGERPLRRILDAPYHVVAFDWSPDSRRIAFEHAPDSGENAWPRSDVSEVDLDSGAVEVLAGGPAAEGEPRYSPDGRFLAYLRTADRARWAGEEQVALIPRGGGPHRALPDTFDRGPSLSLWPGLIPRKAMGVVLGWSADSSRLLFAGAKGTRFILYGVSLDGVAAPVYVPRGVVGGAALNASGTYVGFVQESSSEPPEAFVMDLSGGAPVRVSSANRDLGELPLGETRSVRWNSRDGLEIEGLLTLPAGYQEGKKYPLIALIHGGPMGWWNESFIGAPGIYSLASFAARGYAVLRPNIRGSGGYGKEFRFANFNDWGGKDYEDLMTGVDRLVSTGVADPDRLAVMGWSYGGYMTSWVVTQTNRFKAAVVGAGVTNLWSMAGVTDILDFLPDYFSAEPWDNLPLYLEHSPLYHVKRVATPTLILHGDADLRVPVSQGYEFYNALKRRGVTAEMVVYPGMTHGPGNPETELDLMQRHLDWLERYVR